MIPLDLAWYRRLLGMSVALGLAGGVFGLVYLGATGEVIDRFFGDAGTSWWSGEVWWIPLIAIGGLTVALLRRWWEVPQKVPGGVKIIEAAEVSHKTALQWAIIAAVSAIAGASLGPSFALVVMGGGLGSWLARRSAGADDSDHDFTLTGIAGAFGAAFTSPVLGAFMVSELGPTPRNRYVASIIPQLIASFIGFAVFYSVVGRTFLGIYAVPPYDFEVADLLVAIGLGGAAAAVMLVFVGIILGIRWLAQIVPNSYVRGLIGGTAVGVIAVALPLTLGAGQSQLEVVIADAASLGVWLLIAILLGKMVAMALSLGAGFMGGNVFPLIFIGGTAGVITHLVVPEIPLALALSCMLAAVPGSYLRAPVSMTFIAAIALSLGPETIAPVAVAVVTAYLIVAVIRYMLSLRSTPASMT